VEKMLARLNNAKPDLHDTERLLRTVPATTH
jgi:hypothetical protein